METEVITDPGCLRDVECEWKSLLANNSSASIFASYEWISTWWRHYGQRNRLCIVVARDFGKLVGAAPLYLSTREGFRHLGMIGASTVDYEDLIVHDRADRSSVVACILAAVLADPHWDVCRLNKFPSDSPNFNAVCQAVGSRSEVAVRWRSFSVAPYISNSRGWDAYWSSRRLGLRRDTERQWRRLEKVGTVQTRAAATQADVQELLSHLVRQHIQRRRKRDYSMFEQAHKECFYRDLAEVLRRAGWLDLQALEVGGRVAAVHFGCQDGRRYYYLIPTFDETFAAYSVGRLLLTNLIEEWADKVNEFDLLRGDEPYKREFSTGVRPLLSLSLFRRTARGLLALPWFETLRPRLAGITHTRRLLLWLRRRGIQQRGVSGHSGTRW